MEGRCRRCRGGAGGVGRRVSSKRSSRHQIPNTSKSQISKPEVALRSKGKCTQASSPFLYLHTVHTCAQRHTRSHTQSRHAPTATHSTMTRTTRQSTGEQVFPKAPLVSETKVSSGQYTSKPVGCKCWTPTRVGAAKQAGPEGGVPETPHHPVPLPRKVTKQRHADAAHEGSSLLRSGLDPHDRTGRMP